MNVSVVADPRAAGWTHADRNVLGLLIFVAAEMMFFAGLISTFLVLRAGSDGWPPIGQPRLPIGLTAANTIVLVLSALTMRLALGAARRGQQQSLVRWLAITAVLGATFLVVQGAEWVRLIEHGLSATASPYGSTFFTIVGMHGLHVAGAMGALALVLARATSGRYPADHHGGVELCWIYWAFVVGLWPVLYVLVYLT